MGEDSNKPKIFGQLGIGTDQLSKDVGKVKALFKELSAESAKLGEIFSKFNISPSFAGNNSNLEKQFTNTANAIKAGKQKISDAIKHKYEMGNFNDFADLFGVKGKDGVDGELTKYINKLKSDLSKSNIELEGFNAELKRLQKNESARKKYATDNGTDFIATDYSSINAQRNIAQGKINQMTAELTKSEKLYETARKQIEKTEQVFQKSIASNATKADSSLDKEAVNSLKKQKDSAIALSKQLRDEALNIRKTEYNVDLASHKAYLQKMLSDERLTNDDIIKIKKELLQVNKQINSEQSLALRKQSQDILANNKAVKQASSPSTGTDNTFFKRFNYLSDYVIASGVIYNFLGTFKKVIDINAEFQMGQVNLQRILKANNSEMLVMKDTVFEIAKETGNQTKDVQDIMNLWIRTGLATKDTVGQLAKVTSIGLNTAQFKDAEEAVSMLNGAINTMANGDVKQAQAILDSWAKTADTTAVKSARDLAEVTSRAGASAKQMGLDYNDLNAITGIVAERMGLDGEKIGTAMKSIFTRIMNPAYFKVLESYGVKVIQVGENGKKSFRNFADIMTELQAKFKEMKDEGNGEGIANLTRALGGTHQNTIIANLVEGWDTYKSKVASSIDSVGFTEKQNENIMQTFDKQVLVLKASLAELALTIGENGLMGSLTGLAKGTKGAVDWFNTLNPHVKNSVTACLELMAVFTALNFAFKKVTKVSILEGLTTSLFNYTKKIGDSSKAEALLQANIDLNNISRERAIFILRGLKTGEDMSTLSAKEKTIALEAQTAMTYEASTATKVLTTALNVSMIAIPLLVGAIVSWKQSEEEATKTLMEHIKSLQQETTETDGLIKEYEALRKKTILTTDEKTRLHDIELKLTEAYPNLTNKIDDQNRAYTDQVGLIKSLNDEKKKQLKDDAQLFLDSNKNKIDDAKAQLAVAKKYQDYYNANKDKPNFDVRYTDNVEKELGTDIFGFGDIADFFSSGGNAKQINAEATSRIVKKMSELQNLVTEAEKNQAIIDTINNTINGTGTSSTNPTTGSGSNGNKTADYKGKADYDPDEFQHSLDELDHQLNMEQLSKEAYAGKLQKLLDDYKTDLESQDGGEKQIWDIQEKIHNALNKSSGSSNTGVDTNKPDKIADVDRLVTLNQEVEKYNTLIEQNHASQELADNDFPKKSALMQQEINYLRNQQQALHALNEERRKMRSDKVEDLSTYGFTMKGEGDNQTISNYNEVVANLASQANAQISNPQVFAILNKRYEDAKKVAQDFFNLQLTDIPKTSTQYMQLEKQINSLTDAFSDNQIKIQQDTQQEMMKLLKDDYQDQLDAEETRHTTVMDNLDKELTTYQKTINDKIKALDRLSDAEDYQKDITKSDKDITDKQQEIDALALDNSAESMARKAQLQTDLDNLLQDKNDKVLAHQKKTEKDTYQDMLDAKELAIKDEQDAETDSYNIKKNQLEDAMKDTNLLIEVQKDLGNQADVLTNKYDAFFDKFEAGLTRVGAKLKSEFINNLKVVQGLSTASSTSNDTSTIADVSGAVLNNILSDQQQWLATTDVNKRNDLHTLADQERTKLPLDVAEQTRNVDIEGMKNLIASLKSQGRVYKNGGAVDFTGLAWVDGTKNEPEYMLKSNDFQSLRDVIGVTRSVISMAQGTNINSITKGSNNPTITNHFELTVHSAEGQDPVEIAKVVEKFVWNNMSKRLSLDGG